MTTFCSSWKIGTALFASYEQFVPVYCLPISFCYQNGETHWL